MPAAMCMTSPPLIVGLGRKERERKYCGFATEVMKVVQFASPQLRRNQRARVWSWLGLVARCTCEAVGLEDDACYCLVLATTETTAKVVQCNWYFFVLGQQARRASEVELWVAYQYWRAQPHTAKAGG